MHTNLNKVNKLSTYSTAMISSKIVTLQLPFIITLTLNYITINVIILACSVICKLIFIDYVNSSFKVTLSSSFYCVCISEAVQVKHELSKRRKDTSFQEKYIYCKLYRVCDDC